MRALVKKPNGKTVTEIDFPGPPGANRRTLRLTKLKAGRYTLALIAIDSSSGLASKTVKRGFTFR